MDNIFIERLLRSVKYEKIFMEEFETVQELLSGLKEYFGNYLKRETDTHPRYLNGEVAPKSRTVSLMS